MFFGSAGFELGFLDGGFGGVVGGGGGGLDMVVFSSGFMVELMERMRGWFWCYIFL